MIEAVKRNECTGCQMCGDICPVKAIKYEEEAGFWYPVADKDICIECGLCTKKCPVMSATEQVMQASYPRVYAAWSADDEERKFSTSGGIYYELAKKMISDGGYIVGVQYTQDFKGAEYAVYNDLQGLAKIRNSKYFQANASGAYKKTKELLDAGEKVLFCGTPCQNEALASFLGKTYEGLVTVDFICLAVNSAKAHKAYVEYLERIKKAPIKYLHFKNKKNGWNRFGVYAEFKNGKTYYKDRHTDLYVRGYVENHLFVRQSCESCKFRNEKHLADITLGDFWGVKPNEKNPNLDYGTSVVFCNTEKGQKYLERTEDSIVYYEQTMADVRGGNKALNNHAVRNVNSEKFLKELDKYPYDKLMKKYAKKRTLRQNISIAKIYILFYVKKFWRSK